MTDPVTPDERPPVAFGITAGGDPTPEQLAALVVALTPVAASEPAAETASGAQAAGGWREAAVLEAVGFRPFVSVDDLVRYHRSIA